MKFFTAAPKALIMPCCLLTQGGHAYSFFKNTVSTTKAPASTDELETATSSRRNLLRTAATLSAGALLANSFPELAMADEDVATPLYFGVGCFWHIQHEFVVQGEQQMLGRGPNQLTSAAGYAGGKSTDNEGRVCYHNFKGVADYGKLGHGEVVGMTIPQSKIGDFSELYFSLYNPKTKDRVDPMDRGAEYRSLIGLPGGMKHTSYPSIENAAEKAGFKLVEGKGNDGDTLGKQIVYVYDSTKFPFYQAEVYHQFHNDFQSPAYGRKYNELADAAFDDGRLKGTGCPDRV
mmetsp:Transcript_15874/g.32531  ORF Transcript_15874/g.32531 Transcript_15874/m.32531 type:complete len:290 (+) Transcript_15874:72-941(+)|eukprot:CAMPEP_0201116838 /NCGR_PEP_ID=MMETSP0850-20130426/1001_1 /ASSEMBLY_ACC=CAM_ASM_000622 /TAXON_ID=183588 /ORGANISM="Pseudo-nitzschia fraudulenta, Strain WWA7" /LENGTH=289 /DNA_ID=CAMNT_0047381023 /DNA_START=61 /DNA_END=930 /DNA_ORIENTATION=+